MLPARVVAGALWDRVEPAATFDVGAGFTALALVGLLLIVARRPAGSGGALDRPGAAA